MVRLLILLSGLAVVGIDGCANTGGPSRSHGDPKRPRDEAAFVLAFVTDPAGLVRLTPALAQKRFAGVLTLSEMQKDDVQWEFLGTPTRAGALSRARLYFGPGEGMDEISLASFSFEIESAAQRRAFFERLEGAINAKIGPARYSDNVDRGIAVRGWSLGPDWQVTLQTGKANLSPTEIVLSVAVEQNP